MYPKEDLIKLEYVYDLIEDIELIISRHGSAKSALADVEGRHALLMCVMQIGENLSDLNSEELKSKLPIKAAYGMRNFIAHNYNGINLTIAKSTLEQDIPSLKHDILTILK